MDIDDLCDWLGKIFIICVIVVMCFATYLLCSKLAYWAEEPKPTPAIMAPTTQQAER